MIERMVPIKKPLLDLLDRIRLEQGSFSAAQKLVAAYVLENYHQIPFLSITALAENIGVSNNTVIKFCNQLGYAKFTEFKRQFSEYAHTELVMYNKLSESDLDESNSHFISTMEEDIAAIQSTLSDPRNQENLHKLLPMLEKASHIYITGGRASGALASLFCRILRYLDLQVHEVTSSVGDYWDRMSMITEQDLVIAFCMPRYTSEVVEALKNLHLRSVPVVLITDTGLSAAHPYADLSFHCAVSSGYYHLSYTSCIALINVICRAAGAMRKHHAGNFMQQLENHLLETGVFL